MLKQEDAAHRKTCLYVHAQTLEILTGTWDFAKDAWLQTVWQCKGKSPWLLKLSHLWFRQPQAGSILVRPHTGFVCWCVTVSQWLWWVIDSHKYGVLLHQAMIILARCFVLLQILDESDKKLTIREVQLHNFSDTIKTRQNTNFLYLLRLMQNLTLSSP